MSMNLTDAAAIMRARIMPDGMGNGLAVDEVCVDSRKTRPGCLFFCIPGERFDGHDFAANAAEAGALAVVSERELSDLPPRPDGTEVPVLLVKDARKALGMLARGHRDRTNAKVVGITGTAGKTTVKECLSQVLAKAGRTAKNYLNLNNQIGLPMSMLAASEKDAFWVMEAGISKPHDMDELGEILRPDLGVILNVGPGHTAGLGDLGVAHYKSLFLTHLAEGGVGLVNADYPELVRNARKHCSNLVMFSGKGRDATYRGGYIGGVEVRSSSSGVRVSVRSRYRLWLDGEQLEVEAPLHGAAGTENVTAIAAAAHILGLSKSQIAEGLADAALPPQRFACSVLGPWTIIDDSYNANPLSCGRTLEAARGVAAGRPLTLVMGEMGELGEDADKAHRALGESMADSRAGVIFWKGGHLDAVREGLKMSNWKGELHPVNSPEEFLELFKETGLTNGVILFKGSRFNHMEEMVKAFSSKAGGAADAL